MYDMAGVIQGVKRNKQPGEDRITSDMLKDFTDELLPIFHPIIERAALDRVEFVHWKASTAVKLFRGKGSAQAMSGYRCIHLMSVVGNCFRKLARRQVLSGRNTASYHHNTEACHPVESNSDPTCSHYTNNGQLPTKEATTSSS